MQLTCSCGKVLTVADELAGRRAVCPGCGATLDVGAPAPAEEKTAPPAEGEEAPRRRREVGATAGLWIALGAVLLVAAGTAVAITLTLRSGGRGFAASPTTRKALPPPSGVIEVRKVRQPADDVKPPRPPDGGEKPKDAPGPGRP
jgi:hypothetical protein